MNIYMYMNYIEEIRNLYYIYNKLYDINDKQIKCSCPILAYKLFILLPTEMLNNNIIVDKNEYTFTTFDKTILLANRILPYMSHIKNTTISFPIPFMFPLQLKNEVQLIPSNVYYYEIKILEDLSVIESNLVHVSQKRITIGFGSNNMKYSSDNTKISDKYIIGFSSNGFTKNTYFNKLISEQWKEDDIIGAGLIYTGLHKIKPFFTYNGNIVYVSSSEIFMNHYYFPVIISNYPCKIKTNFSTDLFEFDIKQFIHIYSNKIFSVSNYFINTYNESTFNNNILTTDNTNNSYSKLKNNLHHTFHTIFHNIQLNSNNISLPNTSITSNNTFDNINTNVHSNSNNTPSNIANTIINTIANSVPINILNTIENTDTQDNIDNTLNLLNTSTQLNTSIIANNSDISNTSNLLFDLSIPTDIVNNILNLFSSETNIDNINMISVSTQL